MGVIALSPKCGKSDANTYDESYQSCESAPLLSPAKNHINNPSYLSPLQKFSFGMGHVINDTTSSLWFSYALLYFEQVVKLSPAVSGMLLFVGQCTDAIATPVAGVLIDMWGTKKKWHFTGVVLVSVGFPFIFHCWGDTSVLSVSKYAIAIIIFQVGWTTVQLSHLSLIPDLSTVLSERASLTNLRYITFIISNISIYCISYFILRNQRDGNEVDIIEPEDSWKFQIIAIVAEGIGFVTVAIFLCVLQIPDGLTTLRSKSSTFLAETKQSKIWQHLSRLSCSYELIIVAFVHTSSRIFYSINLVYIPFYINETCIIEAGIIAMAPIFSFIGSLASTTVMGYASKMNYNNKVLYTIGILLSLLSSVTVMLNNDSSSDTFFIYTVSLLYGAGSALTVVKSLCIAANLIGSHTEDGALVYGLITFCDKLVNGIIIYAVEYMKTVWFVDFPHYYKFVLTILGGMVSILGYVFLLLLPSSICYSS